LNQKSALQVAVAVAGLVPVTAGLAGAFHPGLLALVGAPGALTHVAYLSGLLLGIGLGFWSLIPQIDRQGRAFGLLTGIVMLGGLARLVLAIRLNAWGLSVLLPLMMELAVTPVLWAWQRRLTRSSNSGWE
jgi:hypothetical protein